jgi:hypothetical protein
MVNERYLFDDVFKVGDIYYLKNDDKKKWLAAQIASGGDIAFFDFRIAQCFSEESFLFRIPVAFKDFKRNWKYVDSKSPRKFLLEDIYYTEYDINTQIMTKTTLRANVEHIKISIDEYMILEPFSFWETSAILMRVDGNIDLDFLRTYKFTDHTRALYETKNL